MPSMRSATLRPATSKIRRRTRASRGFDLSRPGTGIGMDVQRGPQPLRALHDDRDALAAADAGGRHAELLVPLLQLEQQRIDEARAGGAEGMAEADGAAVHVHLLAIEAQLLLDRQVLACERLVDLEEIELVELHAHALERLADRRRRTEAHDVGIHADRGVGAHESERLLAGGLRT